MIPHSRRLLGSRCSPRGVLHTLSHSKSCKINRNSLTSSHPVISRWNKMVTKENTHLKKRMLEIFLPHVKACWSATSHGNYCQCRRGVCACTEFRIVTETNWRAMWHKLLAKWHCPSGLSHPSTARQGLPKPHYKHCSYKLQVVHYNCGDFQMQNSSDQKMNGSLPKSY